MAPSAKHFSGVVLSGASIIDLDGTVFVQFGLFLLAFFVLRAWLFAPMLALFEAREKATEGTRDEALKLDSLSHEGLEKVESRLRQARSLAQVEAERLRQQSAERAQALIATARRQYEQRTADANEKLRREATEIRQGLAAANQAMAQQIATKLIGRSLRGVQQ